jgi:hypothetical protein
VAAIEEVPDRLAGLRERIRDFNELIQGATGGRDVAIYRAHRRGASDEQLAEWADMDVAEVRVIVGEIHPDRDGIDLDRDGPRWRVLQC